MSEGVGKRASGPSARVYRGGCDCGAVLYEIELDLATPPECASSVWERAVGPGSFRLLKGDESLSGYEFFADSVHHFFCERCGVRTFSHHAAAPHGDFYSIDVKCLHAGRAPRVQARVGS